MTQVVIGENYMIKDSSKEYREMMQEIMFEMILKADKLTKKLKEENKNNRCRF